MDSVNSKINYIKGLAQGLKIEELGDQGQIITQIIDALEDLSVAVEDVDDRLSYLESFLDKLFNEFELLAQLMTGIDFDEMIPDELLDDEDDDDEDLYEVVCPNCNQTYYADFDDFDTDSVYCPNCNTKFELTSALLDQLKEED